MYTVIALLLLFLITVFSILLYFKSKRSRQELLEKGTCPACHAETKIFKDDNTGTTFSVTPIQKNLLRKHGCSGTADVEYTCNNCDLKEVHTVNGYSCTL